MNTKRLDDIERRLEKLENKSSNQEWVTIGGLEWLKEDLGEMSWHDAVKACEKAGGRLPTRLELIDLVDNHEEDLEDLVEDTDIWVWSATEYNSTTAWLVGLNNGTTCYSNKSTASNYVRCVR
jgi:hypothetical protein